MQSRPGNPVPTYRLPVLALGFRPFYLLACLYAVCSVPLWLAHYRGWLPLGGYFDGLTWHAHELIFGFAVAVISGFLLTAVRNWTGQPTASGAWLGALALLWLAGRVFCLTGPAIPAAVFDLLFLPCLGIALGVPLIKTRNANRFVLAILAALMMINLAMHLAQLGLLDTPLPFAAVTVAFDVIAVLIAVIAGRIIPLFIGNFFTSAKPRRYRLLDASAVGLLIAILLLDSLGGGLQLSGDALAFLFFVAALVHLVRLSLWAPGATRSEPLLWILPLSYLWIPLWLLLRMGGAINWLPDLIAHHALAIGGMTSLMLGMMTRSALGHTGRELRAGAVESSAFVLIQLAVVLRILPLLVAPGIYQAALLASGFCWTAAFALVLVKYTPFLLQPRLDGKAG